jgi:hypothetical protein
MRQARPGSFEMALSALSDKSREPTDDALRGVLGKVYPIWSSLIEAVEAQVSPLTRVWGFTSRSTGWGLRLRHNDRVILYMTPQSGQFLVSFVLGEKAVASAREMKLPADMLELIEAAPRYAEGRGVRLEVSKASQVPPLAVLARIKQEN